jgi:hypothetical protein
MTLRDYFAAKAMQAMLSNPTCEMPYDAVVVCAYQVSDAMLEARDK